jgi:hypothetical protein
MAVRPVVGFLSSGRWTGLLLLLGLAAPVKAEEFYYLLVFSSQEAPTRHITPSHTFATFVKATGGGPCAENYQLEAHTLSWLPESLELRAGALLPEAGQNFGLDATLRWAVSTGQRISLWGPYQIERDLYERGLRQIGFLESGEVRYKLLDGGFEANRVSNCIHAVDAVTGSARLQMLNYSFGETASYHVVCHLAPWIIDPSRKHPWVSDRMDLRAYPVIERNWENPHSGVLMGPIFSLLAIDREP